MLVFRWRDRTASHCEPRRGEEDLSAGHLVGEGGRRRYLFERGGVQARHGAGRTGPRRHAPGLRWHRRSEGHNARSIIAWLRREARRGVAIGGLCTGAYTLAKAGLLDGKKATIHWENQDGFLEEFEDVKLTKSVFVVDGNRLSTAGGTASIDLMLKLIAADHGDDMANTVADQLIYSSIRTDQDTQRLSIPTRIGVRHPKLSQVIQMMENNIEDPISPADLADDVGMSTRQLERLFRRYLNRSRPSGITWSCGCRRRATC